MSTDESDPPQMLLTTAVIPAAGLGTRLRPLTNHLPKELLPLGKYLAMEYILNEVAAAGMKRAIVVVSPVKEQRFREIFGSESNGLAITFAIQTEMRGLGDAVLCAAPSLEAESSFVVALGDAVFEEASAGAIVRRLIESGKDSKIGIVVRKVPRAQIGKYGVVEPTPNVTDFTVPFAIRAVVEKPQPKKEPSDYAASARYLVPHRILHVLRTLKPGIGNEIQLTDAMQQLLAEDGSGVAVPLTDGEVRHDLGDLESYYRAFVRFALNDDERGDALNEWLRCEKNILKNLHNQEYSPK